MILTQINVIFFLHLNPIFTPNYQLLSNLKQYHANIPLFFNKKTIPPLVFPIYFIMTLPFIQLKPKICESFLILFSLIPHFSSTSKSNDSVSKIYESKHFHPFSLPPLSLTGTISYWFPQFPHFPSLLLKSTLYFAPEQPFKYINLIV